MNKISSCTVVKIIFHTQARLNESLVNDEWFYISTYHMSVARLIGSKFSTSGAETIQNILLQVWLSRVSLSAFNQLVSYSCPFFFPDLKPLTTSKWPSEQTALSEKILSDMHRLPVV